MNAPATSPQGDSGRATGQSRPGGSAANHAEPDAPAPVEAGASGKRKAAASGDKQRGKSGAADRPGNQGTIKIDAQEFDTHPNNEPHVGCQFQVDFYNYGWGDYNADVNFAQHPPTPGSLGVTDGSLTPAIGEDPPGGGTDLDAEETYTLDFSGDPHPKQGYHVKLTIHAPESLGADTKHKVFWVEPCDDKTPPEDDDETTPPDDETPPDDDTPPGDDETPPDDQTTPPGDNETTPPGDNETTPPDDVGDTPPEDEQAGPVPALPGPSGGGISQGSTAPRAGIPTSVNAGLTVGTPADEPPATIVLAGLGGLLIAAAGVLQRRRRGDHQV